MPTPPDVRRGVSRRTAIGLVAAGAVAASGCTPSGVDRRARPTPAQQPTPTPEDPDVTLAATVLTGEQAMLDRVVATRRRHPGLARSLSAVEDAHRAHVQLLVDAVPDDERPTPSASPSAALSTVPSSSPTSSPSGSPSASPSVPTPPVSTRPAAALAALARDEERLSQVGKRSAFAAESGAFARVLASMAAAAAQQAVALNTAAAEASR